MKKLLFIAPIVGLLITGCSLSPDIKQEVKDYGANLASSTVNKVLSDKLNLSKMGLTGIPENVFSQTNLVELDVSNNKIKGAIQSQVGQLKELKILKANDNQMTGVPAEIGQLTKLEVLDLSNNQLTGLPNELGNLKNLKTFNISGNNYSAQDLKSIKDKLPSSVNIIQ